MRVVIENDPELEGLTLELWTHFDRVRNARRVALSEMASTVAPDDVGPAPGP